MPLRPAGVHPVEHLGPVLGLRAAGPGVELQNGVASVVLPGEERGHPGGLRLPFQGGVLLAQFLQDLRVVGLLPHLTQGSQVLPGGFQLLLAGDFVLQLFQAGLDLLRAGQVVPEALLFRLRGEALRLLSGALNVQRGGEFLQFRLQLPQFLLIYVVFNQRHSGLLFLISGMVPFHGPIDGFVLYWNMDSL